MARNQQEAVEKVIEAIKQDDVEEAYEPYKKDGKDCYAKATKDRVKGMIVVTVHE